MNRFPVSFVPRLALFLFFVFALCGSFAHAQNALPVPTATPQIQAQPTPTPTATALPSATPGVAATPSPASLPPVFPQAPTTVQPNIALPVPGFTDPNAVPPPAPVIPPTATPEPTPTQASQPTPTPAPGDITGQEEPDADAVSLNGPNLIQDMEHGLTLASQGVTLRYRNFTAKGDQGVLDNNTGDATLTGNLTITAQVGGRAQVFTGKTLRFNIKTGKWLLSNLQTTFPPELFPPGTVLAPLFETDGTVTGQGQNGRGENFRFSSCDRGHYYIRSNRIDFYRDKSGDPQRIVLRKNAIFLLGQEILPLPVYTISLTGQRSRRQPLQTAFGENQVDGFFAKSIYDLRATPKYTDSVLLDALSKRGLGLGLQRELIGGGLLYLYAVSGKNGGREIDTRINKNYQFAKLYSSNIHYESTKNNSLTGSGIASTSGNFSLSRSGTRAQTTAYYNLSQSSFSTTDGNSTTNSNSRNDVLTITHNQNFGNRFTLSATGILNQSEFSSTGSEDNLRQTGDLNVQLRRDGDALNIALITELHNDFTQGNSAYQVERLPELTFNSNTQRLNLGNGINKIIPGQLSLSMGTYNEPISNTTTSGVNLGGQKSRTDFAFTSNVRHIQLLGKDPNSPPGTDVPYNPNAIRRPSGSEILFSGQFEQAFYSDNTARYNYAYNFTNISTLGPLQVTVNYNKLRTFGFTPFQFDYITPGEYVDYVASLGRSQNFNFTVSGGRDIRNNYTRDIIANTQWIPTKGTYLSLGTSYGLQDNRRGLFGDIYGNVRFTRARTASSPYGTAFSLGFRYTPSGTGTNQGLTRVNAGVDAPITRKVRFQALVGYDGVNNRFDIQQYRATIDLHCFNLFTTYDSSLKQLRFDIALKAFPFAETRFGRNNFSEGFDPSVGGIQ